jgi:hypothetical protein
MTTETASLAELCTRLVRWLQDSDQATRAVTLRPDQWNETWGTPHIVGVSESQRSDVIKFPTEVLAAEMLLDSSSIPAALGRVATYRVFCHRSYLAIPMPDRDISTTEAVARALGIGLYYIGPNEFQKREFELIVRPIRHEPEMWYVNHYMRLVQDRLFRPPYGPA